MLTEAPVVVVYDDMGHLCYRDAPRWFELTRAIGKPPYTWLSSHVDTNTSGYACIINRRSCKDPFYRLDTPHGPVVLDLSALPYEPTTTF